jgi:uncharacterized protein (DUF433 family)
MQNRDELLKRITINPGIFSGKPIVRGMRFRVVDMLEMLASGMTHAEILEDFPFLEEEDIRACLYYAALKFNHPVIPSHAA